MPIILITGANGHGKGQFAIKKILELQDENDDREKKGDSRRVIYANIHGVNESGAKPLKDVQPIPSDLIFFGKQDNPNDPPPEGYFIPPIGSVFFFDECQKLEWVKQKSGALSSDIRVRSLEEHRHAGLDIYFITQSPNYIHSHIQGLVSPHYYVERPLGMNATNVFYFNKFQKNPENKMTKKLADDQFMISLGKKYGDYYTSSAEHNIKKNVPLKLKLALGFFIFVLALILWKGLQAYTYKKQQQEEITSTVEDVHPQQQGVLPGKTQVSTELAKAQAELEELKAQFELERLKDEILNLKRRRELIKEQLPQDYEVLKSEPALQVRGVISSSNKGCSAYNTHGDLMNLNSVDCNYYLKEPGRVHKSQVQAQPVIQSQP